MNTQVLIVGAGPVGLTLAIDLGKRGIRTMVIEKKPEPAFLPKMERCNARTMEIFRRLGIVEDVRKAGLREDVPMDVFVILSMTEPALLRLPYPSVREARHDARATNDGTAPCEPYQLISQYTLEPCSQRLQPACRRSNFAGARILFRSSRTMQASRRRCAGGRNGFGDPLRLSGRMRWRRFAGAP
jgi:2-polyprenyl-6-methoxyphenol hydroxylase-like FAD-dependent oxidoreductase